MIEGVGLLSKFTGKMTSFPRTTVCSRSLFPVISGGTGRKCWKEDRLDAA